MSEAADIQRVEIDPVGCYRQAFELLKGRYWPLLGVSVVGMFIGGLVPIVLIGPMMCGVYICFLRAHRGRDFDFELLFKGFDLFVPSLVASLIITGVTMLVLVPGCIIMFVGMFASIASMEGQGGQATAPAIATLATMSVALLVLFALVMVASVFFIFAFPLIADRKLAGTDAIVTSVRAAAKHFWGLLGLMLIGAVLGLAGAVACYVGTFFVLPISFAAMTIAYRKVFPQLVAEPPSLPEETTAPA